MEDSSSWEANSHLAIQKTSCNCGTWRFITVLTRDPSLLPTFGQTHPVHNFPSYFPKIHSNTVFCA
jgi:hypothetical protein